VFWFWFWVGPALALALFALRGERKRAEYVAGRMAELAEPPNHALPPVTVIAKGGALPPQDYPHYEVIAEGADPRAESEIVALAGEGAVSPQWLRALVEPLLQPEVSMSTGFRWYAPDPPAFWPLTRSVWNAVMAGRLGPGRAAFAWEGSVAVRRGDLLRLKSEGALRMSRAIRAAYAPGAMVVRSERVRAGEFFRQARREMARVRREAPRLWLAGLISHLFYCGSMVAIVVAIAQGSRGAEWALVAQFGLGMLKGANRATLAKAECPALHAWFDKYGWVHTFWVPFATWVWLWALIGSAFHRESV
jgi:hypothetical protein